MGDLSGGLSEMFSGVSSGVGDLFTGKWGNLGADLGQIGGGFSEGIFGGNKTGQPASGSPGASPAAHSQGVTAMPDNVGRGAGTSAASFSAGPGDNIGSGARSGIPAVSPDVQAMLGAGNAGTDSAAAPTGATPAAHSLAKDIAGIVPIATGYMGYERGQKQLKGLEREQSLMAGRERMASDLETQALKGHLPGDAMVAFQSDEDARIAQVRATYSAMGLAGSSSEASAINAEKARTQDEIMKYGISLATKAGSDYASAAGMNFDMLNAILTDKNQLSSDLSSGLTDFLKSWNSGTAH